MGPREENRKKHTPYCNEVDIGTQAILVGGVLSLRRHSCLPKYTSKNILHLQKERLHSGHVLVLAQQP